MAGTTQGPGNVHWPKARAERGAEIVKPGCGKQPSAWAAGQVRRPGHTRRLLGDPASVVV